MSNGKGKSARSRNKSPEGQTPSVGAAGAKTDVGGDAIASGKSGIPSPPKERPVRMFRRIDWITFAVVTLVVFIGYFWTLAPDLTLEDSGELAVGSFYAGVPHPPGYPVWTLFTWLFTVLVPFSNIAWRVALASSVAGASACGLIGLMVSRGSSMLLEGIDLLKGVERRWEDRICLTCGFVAGMLFGFNGFFWSQAVIVEVYPLSVLSLAGVLCLLFRWVYTPQRRKYLYWAFFLFGISVTNHQTLIVAAMGLEVLIWAVDRDLGRDCFLGNVVVYLVGLVLKSKGILPSLDTNTPLFVIYNVVGLVSMFAFFWSWMQTRRVGTAWAPVLIMGGLWVLGVSFYLYMPLASMTNPPMNWGYPRTLEGFIHTITRGQYEQTNPTTSLWKFIGQVWRYFAGARREFNAVNLLTATLPFFFFNRLRKRERSWITGLTAVYAFLAFLLLILLNPNPDRQSMELNRVFFTSSHVVIALMIGYGLALVGGLIATRYEEYRSVLLFGGALACGVSLYYLVKEFLETEYWLLETAACLGFLLPVLFTAIVLYFRRQVRLAWILGIMAVIPLQSILAHWADNEQRGHLFGYWFGHDMFTPPFKGKQGKPLYPKMARDAILFGGTDPGRFCPTYMIFDESFIPASKKPHDPEFDRRDVYLITQNALADNTYLDYIRAQYDRSEEHDPPFFQALVSSSDALQYGVTNWAARLVRPLDDFFLSLGRHIEKERRAGTSYFSKKDFLDLPRLAARLRPHSGRNALSKYLFSQCDDETRKLLEQPGKPSELARRLAKVFNRVLDAGPLYSTSRFAGISLSERTQRFAAQHPQAVYGQLVRLNRLLLEGAYPKCIARSLGGVYPDLEIHTPSPEEYTQVFNQYMADADRRSRLGELDPGEIVKRVGNRIQVAGQVSVMKINGLLTKVIFDANPDHQFYVEESFPLKWMYPYLTPYGIIMKIHRHPVPQITEAMLDRDHAFWTQYSQRLVGNWITYKTPVKQIAAFAERLYKQRDFRGFKGDPKFIRDDNAQKSFSKLRSSIAGIYAWRLSQEAPAQYRPSSEAAQQRLLKEADFAFRQAFAFCPYSPEAVFRYVNLLLSVRRYDDALVVARTCLSFDEENQNVAKLVQQVADIKRRNATLDQAVAEMGALEKKYRADPTNLQVAFKLVSAYLKTKRTNAAYQILDDLAKNPKANGQVLLSVAQAYLQLGLTSKLRPIFKRVVKLMPNDPEAWYDLAGISASLGDTNAATQDLGKAITLSDQRLKTNSQARDLRKEAAKDNRFNFMRQHAEFQKWLK